MKYRDENGIFQDLYLPPTGDTLPIGAEVDYDGEEVPYGWEEISGFNLVGYTLYEAENGTTGTFTFDGNYTDYKYLIISTDLGSAILNPIISHVIINEIQFSDVLYQRYDLINFSYNSTTEKTTVTHQYQGNYYNGSNHSENFKVYTIVGFKEG